MATAREIKKRIRSVKNIAQITRALEAEAASKVRKAQARVLASRAYAEKAWEILVNVQKTSSSGAPLHPLLAGRSEIRNVLVILITSDRGLCASYNTNIVRTAQRFVDRFGKPTRFITLGKKGRDSMIRAGANVMAEFSNPANPSASYMHPIAQLAIDEYLSGNVDEVLIAYTDFINTLTQHPTVVPFLPLTPLKTDDPVVSQYLKEQPSVTQGSMDYEYEPGPRAILDEIVPRFTELQLYQAVLESQASEHSARMVAMRNASDNAKTLISELTLAYNKARQAGITAEILDIVGGAEAMQGTLEKLAAQIEQEMPARAFAGSKANGKPAVAVTKTAPKADAPAKTARKVAKGDDLQKLEGIGPKMSKALMDAGLDTYAKLADATEEQITQALEAAGINLRLAESRHTWAEQAAYAARGDWEGLEKFQDTLVGGRKVD